MTCERCGWELRVGDFPFCGNGHDHQQTRQAIVTDDIPGGQVIENLGDQPMTFYSKRAILAEADRRGLRLRDQWAGPSDTQLTNWGAGIDAQTMDNARALLTRGSHRRDETPGRLETLTTSVREIRGVA